MASKKTVVIIGNGIAGSQSAAKLAKLGKYNITVVTPHQFQEVPLKMGKVLATGSTVHNGTIFDLVKEDGVNYVFASCTNIEGNSVTLSNGSQLTFDACVIATGLKIPYFYPDVEKDGTMADRKASVQAMFEKVKAAKSLVIAGGGPVGVESAADIKLRFPDKKVVLVSSTATLVSQMSPQFPPLVAARMKEIGIELITGDRVIEHGEGFVLLSSGKRLETDLYIPAHSHGPNSTFVPAESRDEKGFIKVDKQFRVTGLKNVFALSACSNICEGKTITPVDDQLVTCLNNVVATLEGKPLKEFAPGFKSKMIGPTLLVLGHLGNGVTESWGAGPDVPGCGFCCWFCPCFGGCCADPVGLASGKTKSDFVETIKPVNGQGMTRA